MRANRPPPSDFRITCRVRSLGEWLAIEELTPERLLSRYVQENVSDCCDFLGGFFIDVDDQPWSDESTVDEFWMTEGWFYRIEALLEDATVVKTFTGPWEESNLILRREGDLLLMEDVHHSGHVSMPLVRVAWHPFVVQLLRSGSALRTLLNGTLSLARGTPNPPPELERVRHAMERHFPDWSVLDSVERRFIRSGR